MGIFRPTDNPRFALDMLPRTYRYRVTSESAILEKYLHLLLPCVFLVCTSNTANRGHLCTILPQSYATLVLIYG